MPDTNFTEHLESIEDNLQDAIEGLIEKLSNNQPVTRKELNLLQAKHRALRTLREIPLRRLGKKG